jgi:hypothetical protein
VLINHSPCSKFSCVSLRPTRPLRRQTLGPPRKPASGSSALSSPIDALRAIVASGCGARSLGEDDGHDHAIETQSLTEDENQDHADEDCLLLSIGADTSVTHDSDSETSSLIHRRRG